jgi:ribosomal protein L40E
MKIEAAICVRGTYAKPTQEAHSRKCYGRLPWESWYCDPGGRKAREKKARKKAGERRQPPTIAGEWHIFSRQINPLASMNMI